MNLPSTTKNLFRDLALEFDRYLSQSATCSLEAWQEEIREYLRSGRTPTLFARSNLAAVG
jgi:hypothetical protein